MAKCVRRDHGLIARARWCSAATKKRQQLTRVLERLRAPGLSAGIVRELRNQVTILGREIAELEQG